jgi:uncharacterized protein
MTTVARTLSLLAVAATSVAALPAAGAATPGRHRVDQHANQPANQHAGHHRSSRSCAPAGRALAFSDALDKADYHGTTVGGLSSLAYDRRARAWVSAVDNNDSDPSRIWYFRNLRDPRLVRDPLVLRRPDGTPYDGTTADNEGLAVLPDGNYLVSSETEPSIRIFGRDGVQRAQLPVPARFRVAPSGEATSNATLEGLTISPSGRRVVAAMEGALSGDTDGGSDATLHRFLVYDATGHGWRLAKQVAYQADAGQRIPEVAAVDDDTLIVEEASYAPATGNSVDLYEARGLDRAPDVSTVPDLATASLRLVLHKRLLADLVRCPTLGATAKETQANPLLDNFEGMAITMPRRRGEIGLSLISDDNFSPTQTTRVLDLMLRLRGCRR